jgi:hypothetical protein
MVDEANTNLMREYVLEVSHIDDQNYKQPQ